MDKLNSSDIAELLNHFQPATKVVTSLPKPGEVRESARVFKKNPDGTYNKYEMISGVWIETGTNLAGV